MATRKEQVLKFSDEVHVGHERWIETEESIFLTLKRDLLSYELQELRSRRSNQVLSRNNGSPLTHFSVQTRLGKDGNRGTKI